MIDGLGIIVMFLGFFLAFLPHAVHTSAGLDDETSHIKHVITGIILVIVSLGILVWNNNALIKR